MMARRESCIAVADNERTLEILCAVVAFLSSDTSTFSASGRVSRDCVLISFFLCSRCYLGMILLIAFLVPKLCLGI